MPGITFDTLESVKALKAAGFQEAQAEALIFEFKKVQSLALADLATRDNIADLKSDMKDDIAALKNDTKDDIAALKSDMAVLRSDIRELELRMETRLAETKTEIIKWVLGVSAAQAALIVTLLKLIK